MNVRDGVGEEFNGILVIGQELLNFHERTGDELRVDAFSVAGRQSVSVCSNKLSQELSTFVDVNKFPNV